MRFSREISTVQVAGRIWMPNIECAMSYNLSSYDLENARDDDGAWTRESVGRWLDTHSGDFQSITDFRVDISHGSEDFVSEWERGEDSEIAYNDAMFPEYDEEASV